LRLLSGDLECLFGEIIPWQDGHSTPGVMTGFGQIGASALVLKQTINPL